MTSSNLLAPFLPYSVLSRKSTLLNQYLALHQGSLFGKDYAGNPLGVLDPTNGNPLAQNTWFSEGVDITRGGTTSSYSKKRWLNCNAFFTQFKTLMEASSHLFDVSILSSSSPNLYYQYFTLVFCIIQEIFILSNHFVDGSLASILPGKLLINNKAKLVTVGGINHSCQYIYIMNALSRLLNILQIHRQPRLWFEYFPL